MSNSSIDFNALPSPDVIETIEFEQLFQERKQRLLAMAPQYAEALELESEPLVQNLQLESYREMLLRQRINEAVYANLLATAKAADLDNLGVFYGVIRSPQEDDETFRLRIRDRTIASSTAGSKAHYRSRAIEVDPVAIRDVEIDSPVPGQVRVSVLVRTGYDIDEVVAKVREHVTAEDVQMLTDTVEVVSAELIPVDVTADIHLHPDTPQVIFDSLEQSLLDAWEQSAELGWDLTTSWLDAQLHKDGIHYVERTTPTELISIAANQCVVPGDIKLTLKSRGQ
ncbi:baseplate J/gp47 family protein [Thalassomonas viridans]|uniref:Baseplate J/gp47 family protein n=1 Tax=Thalassomonas viridans TaxID=137584 RepID=A0AAE9Z0Q0_9GAMM|nr:baseplate J/gp47 family protein [Thalassomonas viridans]WDE04676.1 baseplate J/gp47 family protein [Thalassomonas viridans]